MTASLDDDRALIEAAKADPARFVELYDRYLDRVYAFVSRRTHDRAAAEDITSEVFQQALAHLGRFEWRGVPVVAWLFRIASNAIAGRWRQDVRDSHDPLVEVPDTRALEDLERRVSLFQLVDRLPDVQRRVIQMRFVEEKSIREIAAALGRSEGAVKSEPVKKSTTRFFHTLSILGHEQFQRPRQAGRHDEKARHRGQPGRE